MTVIMIIDRAMKSHEPRSSSSCAACKLLKRRCTSDCIFAPYFRSNEVRKFARVHKVFGASNVSKILNEVPEDQREDTVNSLAFEAEARLKDPVYGCIGAMAVLQKKMIELQHDLAVARARLAHYAADNSASSAVSGWRSVDNLVDLASLSSQSDGNFSCAQNLDELEYWTSFEVDDVSQAPIFPF